MTGPVASRSLQAIASKVAPLLEFVTTSTHARRIGDPGICDFVFGNPHDAPLEGLVDALRRHAVPDDKDWFAYKRNEPESVSPVAGSLSASHGVAFEPEDIFMTPGAFGAMSVALRTLLEPGDEVIFLSPPWFFYEPMIDLAGGRAVRVEMKGDRFDLDFDAIAAAITPRTRALIFNSPHNPTGRLYPRADLERLAEVLKGANTERPIVLLSDEAYRRILFDGRTFESPAAVYPYTFVLYTYGKTLLAPGERIGYVAVSEAFPGRRELRDALFFAQVVGGWQFPNAILQRAVADLETLSIDVARLQRRRDRLAPALADMGYDVVVPESTFYMMVRSPIPDDLKFTELLAAEDVFVGPGLIFELPGWFRISLTANDDMVERSLPGFAKAIDATAG